LSYLYTLPTSVSFRGKGLFGYSFGPMSQKDLEVLYVESETGHDTFMICRGVTRTYYVLAGSGSFTIKGQKYDVCPGVLVEVPSGLEYSYSGRMTMLAFCRRSWFRRRDKFTKWNRDVVGDESPWSLNDASLWTRLVKMRVFGKSPTNAFLRANNVVWKILPPSLIHFRPIEWYGRFLHSLARTNGVRAQALNTFFLRNRPELELIRRLINGKKNGDTVRVAVLGCSTGAEVYSIAWTIRAARPDLKLIMQAVDISDEAVKFGQRAVYPFNAKMALNDVQDRMAAGRWRVSSTGAEVVDSEIFERLTVAEKAELFDAHQDAAAIKDWLKEGISWYVADVREPEILNRMDPQDIVVASNFLCHMEQSEAERCLRNIARLVRPHGHLFVSGVDLDVRERVAQQLGWEPVPELLEEIHDGDSCLRGQWPFLYGGLEPLNKRRPDWKIRYAAAFRLVSPTKVWGPQSETTIFEERV
jgi:chemotaxis methyl-accepting protein methylase